MTFATHIFLIVSLEIKTDKNFILFSLEQSMEHQKCKVCGEVKPVDQYRAYKQTYNSATLGRPVTGNYIAKRCKACVQKKSRERSFKKIKANRDRVIEYFKKNPCVDCGDTRPVVLEFDHRDPKTKEYNVAELLQNAYPWEKIKKEIDKCDVRCANCHQRKTSIGNNYYKVRFKKNWEEGRLVFNDEVTL